jgi:hypothetical protein
MVWSGRGKDHLCRIVFTLDDRKEAVYEEDWNLQMMAEEGGCLS